MAKTIFFKDKRLPFLELRYTENSNIPYKPHIHQTFSIGAITSGEVEFFYDDKKFLLQKDKIALINPDTLHSCNPIKNQKRSYYMLYIETNWIYNLQKTLNYNISNFTPFSKVLISSSSIYNHFILLSKKLLDSSIFLLEKEEILEDFILKLINNYCLDETINSSQYKNDRVEKIKEFLKENFQTNPTIEDISNAVGISRYHLIRLFKQHTSITPHAYLLNLKIEYAKKLLKSKMDIAQVALNAGFNDQSHLNRVFKQLVAATPYEYKK